MKMDFKLFKVCLECKILFHITIILIVSVTHAASGLNTPKTYYLVSDGVLPPINADAISVDQIRQRRDTAALPQTSLPDAHTTLPAIVVTHPNNITTASAASTVANGTTAMPTSVTTANVTTSGPKNDLNITKGTTKLEHEIGSTTPVASVTLNPPLLGVNGSGQYHGNRTNNTPKVSEEISTDDNITIDVFKETPDKIKAAQNITDLQYDNHTYYLSVFIGNNSFFDEHWANITKPKAEVHPVLSNSHRRATTLKLSFPYPFYGNPIRDITVATGGFIYTGDHVHNWLAATQYVAPLMANFDTTLSTESIVKLYDDGEKFTALWENVNLQEDTNKTFTFAATLYKNGDVIFAYKKIPIPIEKINDNDHPVKIGISDAYLTDRIALHLRTKTIYEYHRVTFKSYEITNKTVLKLIAQPTCLQYDTCEGCVNHNTGFSCSWCDQIKKCSGGTDRFRQDWLLRNCDTMKITNESSCPAPLHRKSDNTTTYETDSNQNPLHDTIFRTSPEVPKNTKEATKIMVKASMTRDEPAPESHSPIGGVVAVFIVVTLVTSLAAWVLYAFKNPHTRSGQLLIKYRPSQWSWRRGEARYTAATIHM